MGAVVELRNIRHRRGGREVLAIDALAVRAGERLAVLGPNGSGKTTLLRLMAGLDEPTAGAAEVDGRPIARAGLDAKRCVGYATQRPGLLSTTVIRNVELPLRWRGLDGSARRRAALAALERLNAAHLADRRALSLSGGEAQRVSLARALAIEPRLLLLDEPAAGLDATARDAFFDDLEAALSTGETTVVQVTHRAEEALRLADRIAILNEGAVRQVGDPTSVVRRPADATVARLVGYENVLPVEVDRAGQVLIDGKPCGMGAAGEPGPATLAAWAAAIRLMPAGDAPVDATVERVTQGPGRWEVALSEGLRAHLPIETAPPAAGERVALEVSGSRATVIRRD